MQYILTEEEYQKLKQLADAGKRFEGRTTVALTRKQLGEICIKIADTMPVKWTGWGKDEPVKPWGCRVTVEKTQDEWYCDTCPVQMLCPLDKRYSQ